MMSASSGPCVAARNRRASSAQRASGPWWEIESNRPGSTSIGIRPSAGLSPTTPLHAAGMRTEPPMSLPSASGTQPDATAAALPPEEPPGVRSRACGLRVVPHSGLSVCERVGELRRRRLADDDRAGPAQRGDHVGVAVGHPVLERVRAERRAVAGDRRGVLDGDRHAVQHAELVAAGNGRRRPRAAARIASSSQIAVKQLSAGCTSSARASARRRRRPATARRPRSRRPARGRSARQDRRGRSLLACRHVARGHGPFLASTQRLPAPAFCTDPRAQGGPEL